MPCGTDPLALFTNVPLGSRLFISVEGDANQFIASAAVDGEPEQVLHSQLVDTELVRTVTGNVVVFVKVVFTVTAGGQARVRAKVIAPSGALHQTDFCCDLSGGHNVPKLCPITVTV